MHYFSHIGRGSKYAFHLLSIHFYPVSTRCYICFNIFFKYPGGLFSASVQKEILIKFGGNPTVVRITTFLFSKSFPGSVK